MYKSGNEVGRYPVLAEKDVEKASFKDLAIRQNHRLEENPSGGLLHAKEEVNQVEQEYILSFSVFLQSGVCPRICLKRAESARQ